MQNCLGMYIESNLIKYAKVSKDKNDVKIEAFGMKFFDDLKDGIKKVIEETYSFNTPIAINLANEKYLYYDIFALLAKKDIQKTVQTEFAAYCDENKYNENAFETRYAVVPNVDNKDKLKAIQVIVNKIELNRQKQYFEKNKLTKIVPIGTSIATIAKIDKKENAIIVNMEDKTTITTVLDRQVYNVEMIDFGSAEVLEKINRVENSMSKAYEICKETTIYTSNVIEDTKDQPHLENIIPTLYQISQKIQEIVENSPAKISTVYLTGTLSVVNNVDLYFQEFLPTADCKILKPSILEETTNAVNVKDYIEVNSAISIALQGLGEGIQGLNFKKSTVMDQIMQLTNVDIGSKDKKNSGKKEKNSKQIKISFSGVLDKTEVLLIRIIVAIVLINIIFSIFSKMLYKRMDNKQKDIESMISSEQREISKINNDTSTLNSKTSAYQARTDELKAINDKISNIAEMKNSIPNLLNQIMYIIPEEVQLTSIQNTENKHIKIVAESANYDQLGYFIAKFKVTGYLNDVVSSRSQKNGDTVTVTIEGELP